MLIVSLWLERLPATLNRPPSSLFDPFASLRMTTLFHFHCSLLHIHLDRVTIFQSTIPSSSSTLVDASVSVQLDPIVVPATVHPDFLHTFPQRSISSPAPARAT